MAGSRPRNSNRTTKYFEMPFVGWRTVKLRISLRYLVVFAALLFALPFSQHVYAQAATGTLRGQVQDPSGAVIPNATVTLTTPDGHTAATTTSGGDGSYQIKNIAPGTYIVIGAANGFATSNSKSVVIAAGQTKHFNVSMVIEVQQQQVQVNAEENTVGTSPDENANAVVIKGKDLDALSDDPDELSSELQALAGPAAGPNGGEVYIDGFTGGQLPPKSSIREIRINQNPFSAEYDRLGYGRIEIFTKPGTDKLHGEVRARGNDSSFNAANPILNSNTPAGSPRIQEPSYYSYFLNGSVGGPISKGASYYFSIFQRDNQNVNVIDAIDPTSVTSGNPNGTFLNETLGNPSSRLDISPRLDLQLGQSNTLTLRYEFYRATQTNSGVGEIDLPTQAYNTHNEENELQASDSLVLSKNFVDDIRFQYRRIRSAQAPVNITPSVSVQGSFVTGGSNSGTVRDNQDDFEVQNYFTGSKGNHALNFGGRLRSYRDANFTNSGTNGQYTFQSLQDYLNSTPQKYQVTVVNNNAYTARAVIYDSALFYQDDWKVNDRFTFSYGLRWESQNYIHDKSDWAPRFSMAYALDGGGKKRAKTVLRAGYGWFYERFSVPNSFSSTAGAPYVIQALHNNVPVNASTPSNQQIYIVTNPSFPANGSSQIPVTTLPASAAAATYFQVGPKMHAALDMQAAIGLDRQIGKRITTNVTYLYGRGVHQYFTNNVNAPFFDSSQNTYGTSVPLTAPDANLYQYQSGGVYRQNQIIASGNARFKRFTLFGFYSYNDAKADTDGVNYFPSNAHDPGLDYGRAGFDVKNRFVVLGNISAPYALSFAPFVAYNSGSPYNITTGSDLTGNNQFNARPTYAASCNEAGAINLQAYGLPCLNTNPVGTNEKILPYDFGTGPQNISVNLRVSKVIGIGPRVANGQGAGGGGGGHGRGFHGLSGNQGGPGRMDATVPRKYSLTLVAFGANLFNHENFGNPNGVIAPRVSSNGSLTPQPFFGKSQSLAGGFFGPSTAGNRSIFLEAEFHF